MLTCAGSRAGPGKLSAAALAVGAFAVVAVDPAAALADSPSTLDPQSSAARSISDLWWFMLIAATIAFAVVIALVFLAILGRREGRLSRLAERTGGNWLLAIGGVAVPIVVLSVVFVLTLGTMQDTSPARSSSGGLAIDVTARQWFWDVSYPGHDAVTANEIHVPVGEPVTIKLTSNDVVHSFWVPKLNRKIDAIPGRENELSFTADEPGTYRGLCAEFCGLQHAHMGFLVVAQEPAELDSWLADQSAPATAPSTPGARRGEEVFMTRGCASCHTIAGTQARGTVGPDLTHLGSRQTIAAATLDNDRGDLGGWILDPQHIKPGAKMPGTDLSGPEVQRLLDYLEGLE